MATLKAILLLALVVGSVHAYNEDDCCNLAKSQNAFIGLIPDNQTCGQTYSPYLPPAEPLFVPYSFCKSQCSGIQLSDIAHPTEWVAPIAQFIMPSIIFSMIIPRRKKIDFHNMFEFQWPMRLTRWAWLNRFVRLIVSMCCFTIILIPMTIDTIIWIVVIIVGAGNMLVGGLYEAHLDYRIVKYVKNTDHGSDEAKVRVKRELLVTVTSGNLLLENGEPQTAIPRSITIPGVDVSSGDQSSRFRLLNLLGSQASFGSTVGSAVVFYLAPFIYTIVDLLNDPSDEDSAISLSFGMELMIIVHVAIISGCLLASNNPNTAAGIVGTDRGLGYRQQCLKPTYALHARGQPDRGSLAVSWWFRDYFVHSVLGWSNVYETEFQPVSLWSRGTNKMKWIKQSQAWRDDESFRKLMEFTWADWILKVFIPVFFLDLIPPVTGGTVAYMTPPRGIGCRTLSILIYGCCQLFSSIFALIRCALEDDDRGIFLQYLFTGWRYWALSAIFWYGSLVASVGGMLMQIVGIFRNCICHAGSTAWWNLSKLDPPINLATDTQLARDSSIFWMWMGASAALFMVLVTYIGWWYQRLVRSRFEYAVENMYVPSRAGNLEGEMYSCEKPDSTTGGYEPGTEPLYGRQQEDEALQGQSDLKVSARGRSYGWRSMTLPQCPYSSSQSLRGISVDDATEEEIRMLPLPNSKRTARR